jgi:hypothetical protein
LYSSALDGWTAKRTERRGAPRFDATDQRLEQHHGLDAPDRGRHRPVKIQTHQTARNKKPVSNAPISVK